MTAEQLNSLLKQVHTELEQTDSLDAASRDSLRILMTDIQKLLDQAEGQPVPRDPTLIDRLEVEVLKFELSHPLLTQAISQVVKGLADLGV